MRLVIARATSLDKFEILDSERAAVRLGRNAFTRHQLSGDTIAKAARAFRHFRNAMDRHHVAVYRAVATSAAREARNRQVLIDRIKRKSGLELEVISGEEEARLVCSAVMKTLGESVTPQLIFDLGGGSLELTFLAEGKVERRVALPLGTVRLMETYKLEGADHGRRRLANSRSYSHAVSRRSSRSAESFERHRGRLWWQRRSSRAIGARALAYAIFRPSTSACCVIRSGGFSRSMFPRAFARSASAATAPR